MSSDLTIWLVCGASPSVPDLLDAAYARAGDATSIACNSAVYRWLIRDELLDYIWLHDHEACRLFSDYAKYLQRIDGTRLLTLGRDSLPALESRGVDDAYEFIEASSPNHTVTWERGKYTNARTSGGLILQYAINNGATEVHVVGMEGFKSTPEAVVVDHFDGRVGKEQNNFHTKASQSPLFNLIAEKFPARQFPL